mmetsp:Transcript_9124/g.21168  ORF Transcript_9124/g.21168 Transcript_9124/m.21168 type:complete len:415 (+) Transcript_9124:32-1276(+)
MPSTPCICLGRQVAAAEHLLAKVGRRQHLKRRLPLGTAGRHRCAVEASKRLEFGKMAGGGSIAECTATPGGDGALMCKPEWQKVLYLRQPYPDNHVGKGFPHAMHVNTKNQAYQFYSLCRWAAVVVQRVCIVSLVISMAALLDEHQASGSVLCRDLVMAEFGLLGMYVAVTLSNRCSWPELLHSFASRVVLCGKLAALTIFLSACCRTWSKGSIYALSSCLLVLHVVLFNYSSNLLPVDGRVKGGVALKAHLFAVALLGTRVNDLYQICIYLLLSMELAAYLPVALVWLQQKSSIMHELLATPGLVLVSFLALSSWRGAALLAMSLVSVAVLGPMALMFGQRYKHQIHGPWDIGFMSTGIGADVAGVVSLRHSHRQCLQEDLGLDVSCLEKPQSWMNEALVKRKKPSRSKPARP